MRLLGQLCLLSAFVGTGYASFACLFGWRYDHRAARRSANLVGVASFLALGVVMAVLATALITKDFRFAYVTQYSNRHLSWYYSLSALWVGQAGSLLLWSWFSMLLALVFRGLPCRQHSALREPTFGVLMALCWFLIATTVFAADPTAASVGLPTEGRGLSPLLQHPAMLIHPPIIFLGYAAWSIPFALAIAALFTGKLDATWTRESRGWALLAWGVLGAGILLGAQWAYEELGWGGYWGWDPVENGSLIPWLTGTALIHAMMVWQHRGMLKKTTVGLAIATFGMCNFATFLTRSGIFSSLHAFSQSPIGWMFLILMIVLAVGGGVLIVVRRANLRSENRFECVLCRESMILISLITLTLFASVVCLGTLSSALSSSILGRNIVVGVEFYNNVFLFVGLVLLAATGTAPLLRWGASPTKSQRRSLWWAIGSTSGMVPLLWFVRIRHPISLSVVGLTVFAMTAILATLAAEGRRRDPQHSWLGMLRVLRTSRRQYAGYFIHAGLFCLAIGITCSALGTQRREITMRVGERLDWAGRTILLAELVQTQLEDRLVAEARLEITQDGKHFALKPARHFHVLQEEWTTEVAIRSAWRDDFYTILHGGDGDNRARLTLVLNPMMRWLWLGGAIMGMGAVVAIWPVRPPATRAAGTASPRSTTVRRKGSRKARWAAPALHGSAASQPTETVVVADRRGRAA